MVVAVILLRAPCITMSVDYIDFVYYKNVLRFG